METILNEECRMKNEELGRVRARDSHRCNRPLRWLALRLRTFRNSFAGDRRIRQRLRVLTFFILNSTFFIPSSANAADGYRDMLATLEFAQSAKSARAAVSAAEEAGSAKDGVAAVRVARNFKDSAKLVRAAEFSKDALGRAALALSAERFADLRLWVLQNTKPRVFIGIATASPATDMGYFRIDFDRAGKFEKLQMLRDEFGIE